MSNSKRANSDDCGNIDNLNTGNTNQSDLEHQADELLRDCKALGKATGIYTEVQLARQKRDRHEISLDTAVENDGIEVKSIENLFECAWEEIISGANRMHCTQRQRQFLHYRKAGLSYRDIENITGVDHCTVRRQVSMAAARIERIPGFGLWTVLAEIFHVPVQTIKIYLLHDK